MRNPKQRTTWEIALILIGAAAIVSVTVVLIAAQWHEEDSHQPCVLCTFGKQTVVWAWMLPLFNLLILSRNPVPTPSLASCLYAIADGETTRAPPCPAFLPSGS